MKTNLKKKDLGYIIGGAVLGAIGGYIVKNITDMLKQKEIIPPSISNIIKEFSSKKDSEE